MKLFVKEKLFSNQDLKYKSFMSKSIPNIDSEKIIGVRMPILRNIAKNIYNDDYIDLFLKELPHQYHEENILHGLILTLKYKDIDILLNELDKFLPFEENSEIKAKALKVEIYDKAKDYAKDKNKVNAYFEEKEDIF